MLAARAIGWIALMASMVGCGELPWRSFAAAPSSPTRMVPVPAADRDVVAASALPVVLDATHEYSLVELIDIAQRSNPDTRQAWEAARAAAARLGRAEAVYLPALTLAVTGGDRRNAFPSGFGPFTATGPFLEPQLMLTWALLDLPRMAAVDEALAEVQAANFAFTRRHQEVMFAVARAFFTLDANRAQLASAQTTLRMATVDEEAARARLAVGLATQPEVLLTRERRARAAFDVEAAVGAVRSSEGTLAETIGAAPVLELHITPLEAQRLPQRLEVPVQQLLEMALQQRPDLRSLAAQVRAREAGVRGALRDFAPRLTLNVTFTHELWRTEVDPPNMVFLSNTPQYDAQLKLDWGLFEGFARLNAVRAAEAERGGSAAALTAGALRALRETWNAYFDVQTAERKLEYATALVDSAQEAYAATLETYRRGLGTILDVLTAERDLADARSTIIQSRAQLLTSAAALALAVGALPAVRP